MDLSSEPSRDEARIMERQLYRPGQTQKTAQTSPSTTPTRTPAKPSFGASKSSSAAKKRLSPETHKRLLRGLLIAAWLLGLGGISYCVFLPDPVDEAKRELKLVFEDQNLTREQRREKLQEITAGLTDKQRFEVRKPPQEFVEKRREERNAFFKLTPEQQIAETKKRILEDEKRRAEGGGGRGGRGSGGGAGGSGAGGGGAGGNRGGATGGNRGGAAGGAGGNRGGPGGGGPGGGGPGGPGGPGGGGPGGWGGGNGAKNRLDMMDPESRAQMGYMRGLNSQVRDSMGLPPGRGFGGGGPGGFGGGPGGYGGGSGGRPPR